MGYRNNEYEKKKLNKKFKAKKRQDYEKNEDILLRKLQEQYKLCDADG
tara:strand:- start:54 stop:197 length:144 start_codon:yes stop_codon:yes gene_type:complete